MAEKDGYFIIKPDHMHLDKSHDLFYYFTDSIQGEDDAPLYAWAEAVVRDKDNFHAQENALCIKVDLPTVTDEMIEWFSGDPIDGRLQVSIEDKERLEVYRQQLVDSLAKFDKVDYV